MDGRHEFDDMVEAVRIGTILAHDRKQAEKWHRRRKSSSPRAQRGLTGAALEAALMRLAHVFPDNIIVGGEA